MVSTLIETININADDFTDNFLTCPTCMGPYDEGEHSPKLLPCSHTLCRSCLERIALTAIPVVAGTASARNSTQPGAGVVVSQLQSQASIAGGGAGGGGGNTSTATLRNSSNNSLARTVAAADAAIAAINGSSSQNGMGSGSGTQHNQSSSLIMDTCFRCPICRETIVIPRAGGINALPPSFLVNQLLDLVKNQRRDLVPRCTNHSNEELLFCETCDTAFCSICESHCRMISNADHIVIPFSIAIKRMTEIFLFKSNQCINSFNLSMANVQREVERLNETVENVASTINDSFNELKAVIDKRKEETLKSLAKIKEAKIKILSEQMQLIANEKQKVETECSKYNQSQIDFKFLSGQIQTLNEKLDCLRSLCEPRENSFIRFDYKKQTTIKRLEEAVKEFGSFKVSNTYPPLCSARIIDYNTQSALNTAAGSAAQNGSGSGISSSNFAGLWPASQSSNSIASYSANLALDLHIQTFDYYGQKRNEGGDPVVIKITDSHANQVTLSCANNRINDLNNGTYTCRLLPKLSGRHSIEVSIFSRPINHMPIELNIKESIDSLWTFGGGVNNSVNNHGGTGGGYGLNTLINKGLTNNKGSSDRDFNMPISVRCINHLIYVLDSGNNRIKLLNKQGSFLRHIEHAGLSEASSTAMAVSYQNGVYHLFSVNWRLKLLGDYELPSMATAADAAATNRLKTFNFSDPPIQEPINLMETFHPHLFIIEDKKKLHLCTSSAEIIYESLEAKMKSECNIKNITSICCSLTKRRIYVADSAAAAAAASTTTQSNNNSSNNNHGACIYEFDLDWLTDYKLDSLLEKHIYAKIANSRSLVNYSINNDLNVGCQDLAAALFNQSSNMNNSSSSSSRLSDLDSSLPLPANTGGKFTYKKFSTNKTANITKYPSNTSLASAVSSVSSMTTTTQLSQATIASATSTGSGSLTSSTKGTYTSLCVDANTAKLLAAKGDKNKTVIEIFNSESYGYEYAIESGPNDKSLKRVTSMCCTNDGYVVCVDLVQNCVKMFRFI